MFTMAISDLSNKRALHTLQTERLFLRATQASDLDDFFEIFNDEDVMRYWYVSHSNPGYLLVRELVYCIVAFPHLILGPALYIPTKNKPILTSPAR